MALGLEVRAMVVVAVNCYDCGPHGLQTAMARTVLHGLPPTMARTALPGLPPTVARTVLPGLPPTARAR